MLDDSQCAQARLFNIDHLDQLIRRFRLSMLKIRAK